MQTGRVYFRGMAYAELHRMQIDFETTALDPGSGRIFMAAVRDSQGLAHILDAPSPADEAALIADLCALVRARDPDVIENHNLFGFDMPFLEARAADLGVPLALLVRVPRKRVPRTEPGRVCSGQGLRRARSAGRSTPSPGRRGASDLIPDCEAQHVDPGERSGTCHLFSRSGMMQTSLL